MRRSEQTTSRRWTALVTAVLLPAILAQPGFAQTFLPPAETFAVGKPTAATGAGPVELAAIHAALAGETGAAFERLVSELMAASPTTTVDAVILRAGTPVPPGLTAAIAVRRAGMRAEALGFVRDEVEGDAETAGPWLDRLRKLVSADFPDDDLLCAAIGTAAELGRYELAGFIAEWLAEEECARIRNAARDGLFVLFRHWFDSAGEYMSFRSRIESGDMDGFLRAELVATQERLNGLHLRLLESDPQKEGVLALSDPDPAVRAAAATVLGRGVGEGRVRGELAVSTLLAHLDGESDVRAFHATVVALLQLLASAAPDSESAVILRETLARIGEDEHHHLTAPLIHASARLPWVREDASGPGGLAEGITRASKLFGRFVDRSRPLDPDLLIQELEALRALYSRAGEPGHTVAAWARPAHDAVMFLLKDYRGSEQVRLAAAGAVSYVIFQDNVDTLVDVLEGENTFTALSFELLGALARFTEGQNPEGETAKKALAVVIDHVRHDDVNLRRRALEILASEPIRALVAASVSELLVKQVVERLEHEKVSELQSMLLSLLAGFERPDLVDSVLYPPVFENLTRELGQTGARRIVELASTLRKLAAGDPERLMWSAELIAFKEDPDTRFVRYEQALGLMASLSEEGARSLTPEQHAAIVKWARGLRAGGGSQAGGTERLRPVLKRLVEVHLPMSIGAGDDERSLAHMRALFMGDLLLAEDKGRDPATVLSSYEEALSYAADPNATAKTSPLTVVRRDRARFYLALGREAEALADYQALDTYRHSAGASGANVADGLQLFDLRQAARLLGDRRLAPDRVGSAGKAFDLTYELVHLEAWEAEPPAVRLQDLVDLTTRARDSRDAGRLASARALLEDLPPVPAEGVVETNGNGHAADPASAPVFRGLLREREWHESLRALLDGLPRAPDENAKPTEASGEPNPDTGPAAGSDERIDTGRRR